MSNNITRNINSTNWNYQFSLNKDLDNNEIYSFVIHEDENNECTQLIISVELHDKNICLYSQTFIGLRKSDMLSIITNAKSIDLLRLIKGEYNYPLDTYILFKNDSIFNILINVGEII